MEANAKVGFSRLGLQADRMPGSFEFDRIENPVGVFSFLGEPLAGWQRVIRIPLEVQRCACL